jgi:catabolite regulation protein CreA
MMYYRCKRWVINSRTQSLDGKTCCELHEKYLLCAEHFEPSQFMNAEKRSSLIHNAVPTIFSVPNPPKRLASSRVDPSARAVPPTKKARMMPGDVVTTSHSKACVNMATKAAMLTTIVCKSALSRRQAPQSFPEPKNQDASIQGREKSDSEIMTPRKLHLVSKIGYASKCLSRARVSLWRLKQKQVQKHVQSADVEEKSQCGGLCHELNALPSTAKQFITSQIRAMSVSSFGMRWSNEDKLLALGLYYKSPSAYRFMRRTFRLPTERTLQKYISGFNVTTGFESDYMLALQKRAESLSLKERHVVVTFDGMSLRSSLKYLEHDDRIVGFEDTCGFGKPSTDPAKHVLQFMVRGISTRWKQPVGHFFIGNSVHASVLGKMLESLISKLETLGFIVAAVVCDQEASHRSCLASLKVTVDNPCFLSERGNTIYVMHDPPHLIKNVRNNLLSYDFVIGGETVSFKHIENLYELESKNVLRFVPKLTKGHIELTNFKKMNVKLATQTLSHSVACGLRSYIKLKQMDSEAEPTAVFVDRMNRLFDIMNSNSPTAKNKWQRPLSVKTVEQFQELADSAIWIKEWKFKSRKTGVVKDDIPFKQGQLMTINALVSVCRYLIDVQEFRFVLTSRFNQDVVENWFSCVRGKGHNNDSRTTIEYESASKSIAVNWLLEHPEKGSNCQLDCDSFVGLLKQAELSKMKTAANCDSPSADVTTTNGDFSDSPCTNDNDVAFSSSSISDWSCVFSLTDVDKNVVFYIAGYLSRKLTLSITCEQCKLLYIRNKEKNKNSVGKHMTLLETRQFDWSKYGLASPSPQLYDLCCALERIVQLNIEGVMAGPSVMGSLKDIIDSTVTVDSYPIDECCSDHRSWWLSMVVTVFLRIRIHHFVRIRNRELKTLADTKKMKKTDTEKGRN